MEFSQKLKVICEKEGITYKDFSDLTGIPHSTIKKYSMGKYAPSWEQLNKIAGASSLEKYRNFLLSDDGEEPYTSEEERLIETFRILKEQGRQDEVWKLIEEIEKTAP